MPNQNWFDDAATRLTSRSDAWMQAFRYSLSRHGQQEGREMKSAGPSEPHNVSFAIRLWQERGHKRFWRGRIIEVEAQDSIVFEDERGLLTFIRTRLLRVSGTKLRTGKE
jgi:hypothetical protein